MPPPRFVAVLFRVVALVVVPVLAALAGFFAPVPVDGFAPVFGVAFLAVGFAVDLDVDLVADFVAVVSDGLADVAGVRAALVPRELLDALDLAMPLDRARFVDLSPIGSALPTAFTAPPATSPTVPAIFPAVRPTLLTTLPGSGIGCPPFVRLLRGRSSPPVQGACPSVAPDWRDPCMIGG